MKTQRDKLKQYQKRITTLTALETDVAKRCLAEGKKDRALLALRRKKYQESLLSQTDGQLEQLEKLTMSVEFALVQKDVLFGLEQGNTVLKEIHREMGGIENVERILEESEEGRRMNAEIEEALAGRLSNLEEDEVEDELEALEREVEGVRLPDAPRRTVVGVGEGALPEVPATEVERDKKRKERAKERKAALEAA